MISPAVGRREAGRAVDQRRLAGAVGAQEAEERAVGDLKRDVAQRLDPGRVALRVSPSMSSACTHLEGTGGLPVRRCARAGHPADEIAG